MAREIVVPELGESVTEATVAQWFKAVGDTVAADEPLVELETDKVTLEVPAPAAGKLTEIAVESGADVEVGALLGRIEEGAGSAAAPSKPADKPKPAESAPAAAPKPAEKPAPQPAPAAPAKAADQPLSPAVRKLVEENRLDPSAIAATGKDGRLTKGDVLAHLEGDQAAPPADARATAPGAREERVRMSRLRKRVAERLKEAQNTAAMLTTFNEVDMSALKSARTEYRDGFEKKYGVRLGYMSFFVKAAIVALKELPEVNAQIEGEEIVYKNHYDIGVAVGSPQGLVVPVLRDVDQMDFADIEKQIGEFGTRARDGKLTMEELTGGTFTISNGGVFGSLLSTPIINPPQSAILGMHKIQDRAVVIDGKVEVRPMMYLALTYDHRLVDGREAVTFLVRIKECIEDPKRILLDI
ncbi:MAG: 2-oxoglutarate dehydrogenase complex dihydrolipoyllysine-residue succinyltransferase [Alphaproteobacteria bacterium]|nr:2-oxoglutarate dehydrogenase complex dihydrolipoyllysine-residue succinyltransferase [Alphaproteobacteria bacterium]